jgi:hypothetical protein
MTNYMIHYIILSDYGTSYALIILCSKNIELIFWITSLFCGFLFLSLICVPWQTRGLVLPFAGLLQSTSVFWFFYVLGFPIYFEMLNCRCPGFHSSWHVHQTLETAILDMFFGVSELMTASIWANYYIFFDFAFWGQSFCAHFRTISVHTKRFHKSLIITETDMSFGKLHLQRVTGR